MKNMYSAVLHLLVGLGPSANQPQGCATLSFKAVITYLPSRGEQKYELH